MRARKATLLLAAIMQAGTGLGLGTRTKTELASNELRMQVFDGYLIVVQGSIGNRERLNFLLDTGVTRSAIDRRAADAVALPTGTATLINFDKTIRVESCEVPELAFGPEHASNLKMTVADLGYLGVGGVHVDAVIGWDLLKRKSFRLDFARRLVIFEPKDHRGKKFASIWPSDLFLMVAADVDGLPVRMVADTGAQGVTFYQERLAGLGARYKVRGDSVGRSVGGTITARIATVARLRLGAQDLDRTVHVVQAPLSGLPEGIAGYLGFASLNAREIEFNFEKNELRWSQ